MVKRILTARQKLITACIIVAVLASGLIVSVMLASGNQTPDSPTPPTNVTITGKIVCLPHKDTSGPQTMECAYGLLADDDKYYGLREAPFDVDFDKPVKVTGSLQLGSDNKYATVGTITVDSIEPKK